jgi:hypothetical protein
MYLYIKEAQKKICVYLFPTRDSSTYGHCQADKCMMWRFMNVKSQVQWERCEKEELIGYCSLAGKP